MTACRSADDGRTHEPGAPHDETDRVRTEAQSASTTASQRRAVPAPESAGKAAEAGTRQYARRRHRLVERLAAEGIRDPRVLAALRKVPRHELVPADLRDAAYQDRPLPIGDGQTISQPAVVALMTELADIRPTDRVLEVGTGSGYQAAVLAELTDAVYTIEILPDLAARARRDLTRLGYADRIRFRVGDGHAGWPEAAPFDAIVVTAAPQTVPVRLKRQLAIGGRLVIPVGGSRRQRLKKIVRTAEGFDERDVLVVLFVPMVSGEAEGRSEP
ncbi:MAG TPA: protein-L-isoaspartate(D-aspartate) O-methyltransferase [Myxococcales bacterium LLY-WYZ-16_1]|nr:protein-L-isoaspartate(D-aspartate) O-methyltransferase [Myxococcales bacterium LLY-WYZ-16_1]